MRSRTGIGKEEDSEVPLGPRDSRRSTRIHSEENLHVLHAHVIRRSSVTRVYGPAVTQAARRTRTCPQEARDTDGEKRGCTRKKTWLEGTAGLRVLAATLTRETLPPQGLQGVVQIAGKSRLASLTHVRGEHRTRPSVQQAYAVSLNQTYT